MKKLILIIALVLVLTTSAFAAVIGVYDLTGYSDNHANFLSFLDSYYSPWDLFAWMQVNFTRIDHIPAYTPYQQWIYKNGDCNDMSTFFLYYYSRHASTSQTKQVYIRLSNNKAHMLGIMGGYGTYWYSSDKYLSPSSFGSIAACVTAYDNSVSASVLWYNVYDYDLNLVQSSKSPAGVPDIAPTE